MTKEAIPRMKRWFFISSIPILCLLIFRSPLPNVHSSQTEVRSPKVKLYDLELWDQDGRKVKFRSDVVGDKVVAIVPFYTTCTTAYPILIFIFTRLQEMLGDRLGKEVLLISISVDPKTDIPIRLKAFARKQKARPGWVFLSGELNPLATVLSGIGIQYIVGQSLDEHQHIPLTLIGHTRGGWKQFHGYPPPETLLAQIHQISGLRLGSEGKD